MTLPDDLRASGRLFVRRGDGASLGWIGLKTDGWHAAFNPPGPGAAEGTAPGGFPSAAALAWMAGYPEAAGDLSTVPGAHPFGPGAILPLTLGTVPPGGSPSSCARTAGAPGAARPSGASRRPASSPGATAPPTPRSPALCARTPTDAGQSGASGAAPQTYASRLGSQAALGAHLAEGAATAHVRLTLATLPEQAIDHLKALQADPLRPEGPARLGLSGRVEIVRGDGALVGIATALSEGRGFRAEPTGRPSSHHGTPDAAVAAAAADSERLPDLLAQGTVMLPLGLALRRKMTQGDGPTQGDTNRNPQANTRPSDGRGGAAAMRRPPPAIIQTSIKEMPTMKFRHTVEGPDYGHAEAQAIRANLAEARQAATAKEPWIVEKAERVAARYLTRRDALLAKAARGERAALALLAKAPARQGLHQAAFADWLARLQKRGLISEVEALPSGGANAQILDRSGRIVPRLTVPTGDVAGKALNFRLTVPCRGGEWDVFVAHSYTGGDGGSQDNQFQEIRAFLANAGKNASQRTIFVAVCDGAYYVADRGAEKTRLDVLIGMQVGLKTVAVTSKRLPEMLRFLSRMHATMRPAEAIAQPA